MAKLEYGAKHKAETFSIYACFPLFTLYMLVVRQNDNVINISSNKDYNFPFWSVNTAVTQSLCLCPSLRYSRMGGGYFI